MAPKAVPMTHARLQAAITGQGREISAAEAKRRSIMAAARRVSNLERRVTVLRRLLATARGDLRFARREFKALTQEPAIDVGGEQ